jgi:HEPN domain-containing protein
MTPQREEAERFLRLAKRDQAAFAALLSTATVDPAVAFFHAQQAAETALKAVMCLRGLTYRRTHDLEELAGMLSDVGAVPPVAGHDLRCLTPYAVEFRYDDEAIHLNPEMRWGLWSERCLPGPMQKLPVIATSHSGLRPFSKETLMLCDVVSVKAMPNFQVDLQYKNGERRLFDVCPLLGMKPWNRIARPEIFALVKVEYGTVVWPGAIDIAPETLDDDSVLQS